MRAALFAAALAAAAPVAAQAPLVIGHLALEDDARYVQAWGYARLVLPPPIRTREGAEMALEDLAFVADAAGIEPVLDAREAADLDGIEAALTAMSEGGTEFVVLDLPGAMVAALAAAAANLPVTLINATAPEDALRSACHANLLHAGPSDGMLMDAFAQYLMTMGWTEILLLVGEDPRDAVIADAFARAAERLRLAVVETRPFTLAADPGSREGNNVRLLTGDAEYDAVFVADARGEFGRFVPYATQLPRPVIGTIGLTSQAWHWALERDGATQVSSRFDKMTGGRRMTSADWAVWIAVKSIVTAATKTPGGAREDVAAFMRSPRMRLDGSKGVTLNYRTWDGQLRMPILLATGDAVIAIAPVEGFLHPTSTLDTLGTDEAEFVCD